MSDFSLFSLFTAGLVLFAPLTTAYTKPVGDAPKGNPISQPGLASIVPVGEPFSVTWEPTTEGTVTLVLLKGPSENAQPQYAIAEEIENSGLYAWTPKDDLEPTTDATGYGIQLIVDKTGQYQYTTQFGISNPDYDPEEADDVSGADASSSAAPGGYGSRGGHGHGSHNVHGGYTHPAASGTASAQAPSYTHKVNGTASSGSAQSTGYTPRNVTLVAPTGGYTASTPVVSATASSSAAATESDVAGPQATDNAAAVMISSFGGLVLAAGAAVFAL